MRIGIGVTVLAWLVRSGAPQLNSPVSLSERCDVAKAILQSLGQPDDVLVVVNEHNSTTPEDRPFIAQREKCSANKLELTYPTPSRGQFRFRGVLIVVEQDGQGWSFYADRITVGVNTPAGYVGDRVYPGGEWHGSATKSGKHWDVSVSGSPVGFDGGGGLAPQTRDNAQAGGKQ